MQTCGLATARSADVRLACRHAVGGGAARSLSSPVARRTRWTRGSSGVRLSRAERARVVAAANAPRSCDRNLLVVGPGVLGSLVCQRWLNLFPAAIVKGQTNTEDAHERLESLGVSPRLKTDASPADAFPFVVFSAPPSGSDDYAAEVRAALKAWDGTGGFVFTSSTAVYAGKDGEECDESTPEFAIGENPRADRLLQAEAAVLEAGGCVVRLSGLYHATRGAHMYFLKSPELKSGAEGLVNLVHYEDAASAVAAALVAQLEGATEGGEVFLATDGVPISRRDMVQACLDSGKFEGAMPAFAAEDDSLGKRMSNPRTARAAGMGTRLRQLRRVLRRGGVRFLLEQKEEVSMTEERGGREVRAAAPCLCRGERARERGGRALSYFFTNLSYFFNRTWGPERNASSKRSVTG